MHGQWTLPGYPADFVSGVIAMGNLVVAVFFLCFWRRTGDRLFLNFSIAFALLAASKVLFAVTDVPADHPAVFLLRLIGFLLIIVAIVQKNVGRTRS